MMRSTVRGAITMPSAANNETSLSLPITVEETAEALGISRLTVIRDWNFARAWLLAEMSGREA